MVYTSLDQTRLGQKEPLHALYAAKKLNQTDRQTDRQTDIAISRAPMELKIIINLVIHSNCSQSYNMDRYPFLSTVNSQVSEQRNRSLRKFIGRLAKIMFKNHLRWLELLFAYINLKEKKKIKQPFKDKYYFRKLNKEK